MKHRALFSSRTPAILSLLLIAVVCLIVYSNTFHVPFQFDDPGNIDGKPFVRDIGIFFDPSRFSEDSVFIMRPVTYFTFALNYRLHGTDVVGYHVVNLIIHILNGFLVYFLVLLTFKTPYFRSEKSEQTAENHSPLLPLFAALLFASHPVLTQAVTYIVQRAASLATLFFLLSLVMYIKGRLASQGKAKAEVKGEKVSAAIVTFFVLSFLSAVLAMKTKEIAFTLPLVAVLYEFMFFSGPFRKRLFYLLPLLLTILIIPYSLIRIGELPKDVIGDVRQVMRANTDISRLDYLLTQFRVIVTYIRLLFFPVNQNLDYDYPVYHSFFDPNVFLSLLFLLSIFGIGVYLLYKTRQKAKGNGQEENNNRRYSILPDPLRPAPYLPTGQAGALRLISFGIFWFFITLSVESSVIPILDVIFEHRIYLPSVGFFIAAAGSFMFYDRLKEKRQWAARAALALFVLIIVLFSAATYARNNVWRSEVALWADAAEKSPMNARAYNGLGLAYQKEGRLDLAIESFQRAVALDPYFAVPHNSLGTIFFKKKLFNRSAEEFSIAIALDPKNVVFYNNRGQVFAAAGEIDRAAADYLTAIRLDPDFGEAYHNLGSAYYGKGLYDKALEEYTRAITIVPDNAVYYNNRGLAYAARGDFEKAASDYMKAIALKPDFAKAYAGMGVVNGELGRFDAAVADFTRALSLDASNASAYVNRGVAYERMQDIGKALSDFQRACEMGDSRGCSGADALKEK